MTEWINKAYVQKYLEKAEQTENEDVKKDCLYRVGTHLEVIPCNGNSNLTQIQQNRVIDEATKVLGEDS